MDWDDAYANRPYIPNAESYEPRWATEAAAFRQEWGERADLNLAYGEADRRRLDLFRPSGETKGLFVFVHGGYWMRFDKSIWSHLARGALARGWAVAMPSYTLAPAARVSEITTEIGHAITFASSRVGGPLRLAGHSAGGHLVTRMICDNTPLPATAMARLQQVVSISGLHDLRPLLATKMNDTLRLTENEAAAESAALRKPIAGARVACWVGGAERPEFLRQTDLLANIWTGLGAETGAVHVPERHHFDIIDELANQDSELCRLCAP
jgi:arylformamidase